MRIRSTTTPHTRLRFQLILDAARRGLCFCCIGVVPPAEVRRAKRIMRLVRNARAR